MRAAGMDLRFTRSERSLYSETVKVGRNDPCPCGSGRKYKHCCLRKDEAARGTNGVAAARPADQDEIQAMLQGAGPAGAGASVRDELIAGIRSRSFGSMSEVERFIGRETARHNEAPVDDFEGLSADQMHRLLSLGMSDIPDIGSMNDGLPDELALEADVVATSKWILEYFGGQGGEIRLTDRGNFPRVMCARFLGPFLPPDRTVPQEASIPSLFRAHELARAVGYIGESYRKAWITTEGVQVLTSDKWAQAFRETMRCMLDRIDWMWLLPPDWQHDHFRFIRDASPFALRLLARHPKGSADELFERFARAFPAFVEPAGKTPASTALLHQVFTELFLRELCKPFGLVVLEWTGGTASASDEDDRPLLRYETTALFREAFRWV